MAVHYFTLKALSKELHKSLQNSQILEVFSQNKNELCISIHNPAQEQTLCISIEPKSSYCVLQNNFSRAKKNSVDLFPGLIGLTIERVTIHSTDRILQFHFQNQQQLLCRLYNTAASNIILIHENYTIIDSFKRSEEYAGTLFEISERFDEHILTDEKSFSHLLQKNNDRTVLESLRSTIPILGTLYAEEILFRAGVDPACPAGELTQEQPANIFSAVETIFQLLEHPQPATYTTEDMSPLLSMFPLRHLGTNKATSYHTVNEAIQALLRNIYRTTGFKETQTELLKRVEKELHRLRMAEKKINAELSAPNRPELYEQMGHTLMAHLYEITKGEASVKFPGIMDESSILQIQLDPSLTPHQNAERYFEKSRKAKAALEETLRYSVETKNKIARFEEVREKISHCQNSNDLKLVQQNSTAIFKETSSQQQNEERLPFRIFTVAGGLEVWVGKNSATNDLLTLRYAKPNDLWFHARGAGGSHTVLKIKGGKIAPPKEAILQAAAIAAYYSKMRNSSHVPVSYCERKYIRKPKHAPQGAVTLEREEVVFVEPKLP